MTESSNRGRLAFELWPDSTESQALGNLRKLLHDLRRELPEVDEFLEISQQTIRWRPDAPVQVDLLSFRRALAEGDLTEAMRHYGGDFVPASYDDRIVEERERLRAEAVAALLKLAARALDSDEFETAAGYARRVLTIDNLSEPAYRTLMTASARLGDRAEAFRTYHRCVEVLRREVGVEPDESTRAAYEQLTAQTSAAPRTPQLSRPRFVGRDPEFARSRAVWAQAVRGRAQLLVVTGEPGIGKTRLVEELAGSVVGEGAAVARARAYQASGHPPWGPVIEWLRSPALQGRLGRLEPVWLAELGRLIPEIRRDHSVSPPSESPGDAGRQRLLDALARAFLATGRPLLLVLDDLQWADQETVQMIGHLLATAPDASLLVAATLRSDETDPDDPVAGLKQMLTRDGLVTEIELDRLDPESSAELAAGVIGRPLDRAAAEQLWKDAEGQPLFIVEAARTGLGSADARLSRTVRAVITSRLAQLTDPARRLVELAATVGRSFSVDVLAAASGSSESALVDALDEAWRRQILREQGGIGYDFSHERIREVAYDLIPPARRRALHRSVASALESVRGSIEESVFSTVASHYESAGMLERAVAAYQRAGTRSVEVFALDDAIGAFRRALMLLERQPAGKARENTELELRMALGVPLVAREGYGSDAVQDCYSRVASLCERLGRRVEPPALRGLGLAALMSCRFDRSAQFGELLLEHSENDPTASVEGHYLLGVGSFWRGDLNQACRHLQAAIEAFRPEDAGLHLSHYGQDPKAVCLIRLAVAQLWVGRPDSSRRLAADAVRYASSLDHPTTEGYVRMYTAMLAAERDEIRILKDEVAAGEAIWSQRQLGYFVRVGRLMSGWLDCLSDDNDLRVLKATLDGWRFESQTLHLTYGLTLLTRAHVRRSEWEAGEAAVAEALRWTAAHDQRYLEPELLRLRGELSVLKGNRVVGLDALRKAIELARSQGAGWFELKAACSLARHDPGPTSSRLVAASLSEFDEGNDLALVKQARQFASDTG
ncbi:MAG TPA: AAA family ATPase [Actinomycetota bacterium]|nr:AAA family ATPase [Actinomycetota bacterium]